MSLRPENARTLENYYARVNQGDFMGVEGCLSSDVVFSIPGNKDLLPFSGEWSGKDNVLKLFGCFENAFWIIGMNETRTITSENEVFSFNDEAFKVKTTGRYYRVAVLHHITFDENSLIKSLENIHDTYVAEQAFSNKAAIVEPILCQDMFAGEAELDENKSIDIVGRFFRRLKEKGKISDLISEDIVVIYPGNPEIIPFSGVWVGKDQISEFFKVKNSVLVDQKLEITKIVANNGTVVVWTEESCTVPNNGKELKSTLVFLIQVTGESKIGRISVYSDTAILSNQLSNH